MSDTSSFVAYRLAKLNLPDLQIRNKDLTFADAYQANLEMLQKMKPLELGRYCKLLNREILDSKSTSHRLSVLKVSGQLLNFKK